MNTWPYELRFEVRGVREDIEDAIAEAFDCLISGHSGVTSVTLSAEGDTCLAAALSAIDVLRALGAAPIRLIDDLVGRREIARRAGVTPQAVGLWIRGERHASSPFPPPFIDVGGGLWLWGEVVPALAERGVLLDEGVEYPTRLDAQRIGGILAAIQLEDADGAGGGNAKETDPLRRKAAQHHQSLPQYLTSELRHLAERQEPSEVLDDIETRHGGRVGFRQALEDLEDGRARR